MPHLEGGNIEFLLFKNSVSYAAFGPIRKNEAINSTFPSSKLLIGSSYFHFRILLFSFVTNKAIHDCSWSLLLANWLTLAIRFCILQIQGFTLFYRNKYLNVTYSDGSRLVVAIQKKIKSQILMDSTSPSSKHYSLAVSYFTSIIELQILHSKVTGPFMKAENQSFTISVSMGSFDL